VSINHEASQLAHMTMGTGKLSFFFNFKALTCVSF